MSNLLHQTSHKVEILNESTDEGKNLYIEGIFAQAEVKNGNGRIYPQHVMEKAVARFNEEYVNARRALGEINHPDRVYADPSQAAIRIVELRMEGPNAIGKALVLNTDKGRNLKGLIDGGFALGVSTRGVGSIKESNGTKYVQSDFMMTAIDAVDNPSGPDCYVDPVIESKWSLNESGVWVKEQNIEEDWGDLEKSAMTQFKELFKNR